MPESDGDGKMCALCVDERKTRVYVAACLSPWRYGIFLKAILDCLTALQE
jgi:hypothetical protein